ILSDRVPVLLDLLRQCRIGREPFELCVVWKDDLYILRRGPAEKMRREIVELPPHAVARPFMPGFRENDQIEILVVLDQRLDELEHRRGMTSGIQKAVYQQEFAF